MVIFMAVEQYVAIIIEIFMYSSIPFVLCNRFEKLSSGGRLGSAIGMSVVFLIVRLSYLFDLLLT